MLLWYEPDACSLCSLTAYIVLVRCSLRRGYMRNKIILKLFQCFISHVTTSETEIKLFHPLKEFQNHFSDNEHVGKYS